MQDERLAQPQPRPKRLEEGFDGQPVRAHGLDDRAPNGFRGDGGGDQLRHVLDGDGLEFLITASGDGQEQRQGRQRSDQRRGAVRTRRRINQ